MNHKFKIRFGETTSDPSVEMDGVKIEGVRRVAFDLDAHASTMLTIEIYGEIEIEGELPEKLSVKARTFEAQSDHRH